MLGCFDMNQCLQCKSTNVSTGKIVSARGVAVFQPSGMKFWAFSLLGGTRFSKEAFACLDCGLVWSSTSIQDLREFIAKHCEKGNPLA